MRKRDRIRRVRAAWGGMGARVFARSRHVAGSAWAFVRWTLRSIGRARPATVATLYLVAIPAFAGLYTMMWRHFYQATARHEASTLALAARVSSALRRPLSRWFKALGGAGVGLRTPHGGVAVVRVSATDAEVTFVTPCWVRVGAVQAAPADGTYRGRDGWSPGALRWTLEMPGYELSKQSAWVPAKIGGMPPASSRGLFGAGHMRVLGGFLYIPPAREEAGGALVEGALEVPGNVLEKLRAYHLAAVGFPAPIARGFLRFLYFSAVTITTLGYGDIVPMTDTARTLVAVESMVGVVGAGLFVNAVAWRVRRGQGPSR